MDNNIYKIDKLRKKYNKKITKLRTKYLKKIKYELDRSQGGATNGLDKSDTP